MTIRIIFVFKMYRQDCLWFNPWISAMLEFTQIGKECSYGRYGRHSVQFLKGIKPNCRNLSLASHLTLKAPVPHFVKPRQEV
jgi:hypothetical protein